MSMINKDISDFRTYAFHENDFKFVSKEDILGKWSVFFFYPADFTFLYIRSKDITFVCRRSGRSERI